MHRTAKKRSAAHNKRISQALRRHYAEKKLAMKKSAVTKKRAHKR